MIEKFKEMTKKEFNILQKPQYAKIDTSLIINKAKELYKYSDVFVMYNWMVANIARYKWDDNIYPLKKNFYEKGYLTCTFSIKNLAIEFGISTNTILKNLKLMEELGWIDITKIKTDNNKQNVYILGDWKIVVVDGEKKYFEELYINYRWY
jgi:DNA-binding MarR family transcriptional regulator